MRLVLLVAMAGACSAVAAEPQAGPLVMASKGGPAVEVRCVAEDPAVKRTAAWLVRFLEDRGYRVAAEDEESASEIVLENAQEANSAGLPLDERTSLRQMRADAFQLLIYEPPRGPIAAVIGRNPAGVRAGIARLIALLSESEGRLLARPMNQVFEPFIPIRRLMVCPTGRIAQANEWTRKFGLPDEWKRWADTLWTNWSDDRIRRYAEQLWLMGFNSVETGELRGYRGVFSDEDLRERITPKLRVFMQAARDHGMQVSQFIWGQSLFVEGENLCWNSPGERARMQAEFRRLAQTYGDLVDSIVVHVGDPGGCSRNGCDPYRTTQEIASCLQSEYRKVNPSVTATLSTWANAGFWNGADGAAFLDESYSSKDLGIALHRWYDAEQSKRVVSAGRALDIWGWYLGDMEMNLDMSLFLRRLDSYFRSLPVEASRQVRALSTELCFSGWPQIINAYVSAQKMLDPRRDLAEIEREFCGGMFGDENADAMVKVYSACEEFVHPDRYYGFIPPTDCLPVVFGTSGYNAQLRESLTALDTVKLGPSNRFGSAADPREMLDYLSRNLRLIAVCSDARERLDAARAAGVGEEKRKQILGDAVAKAAPYSIDLDYPVLMADLERAAAAPEDTSGERK